MEFLIRRAETEDKENWLKMRQGIWPEAPNNYLHIDMDDILESDRDIVFIAFLKDLPIGMIEASVREYAEGCETGPVGYIEAWYVNENFRGSGIGGKLMQAAEAWARKKGCTEMASDTWLDNEIGIQAHLKQGYVEVERLVHFVKSI